MSWLNLNQSLNSLKGQITNFASEVLAEGSQESGDDLGRSSSSSKDLEEKCRSYEAEIAALKTLNDNLQSTLQKERVSRQNGVQEDESNWYWDPPAQPPKEPDSQYDQEIRALQEEISVLKQKCGDEKYVEEMARLKDENLNLTANLEDLDSQHQLAMERLLSLKKELQKNFEVLKQEHEELKSTNDEYSVQVQKLLGNVKERDEEIKVLKGQKVDYETLHHKYLNLEKVHSLLRDNAEKFQEENQELHEEVFKLQEQVTKLEHEIELSTKHSELSNSVPRETFEELQKELHDLKANKKLDMYQPDEVNIDDNAKSVIENLKREISELKHRLIHKEDIDNANKFLTLEKIMQLYNKYVNFELPVDYIGEIPTGSDNAPLFKLESTFKTVNTFKKNIDMLEHKLSEKNHNINHMQTQIDDLISENEFLNTDIQHLESEFNEMKKNNDFLISEITALKNTSKLEPIIETHEDNLAKLETELADCNRINRTFESEIQRIEQELNEVHSEKKLLQSSLHDLRTKYTKMLHELEMCKSETKAAEEMETSVNKEHSNSLKKSLDEIDDLKKRLNSAHAKNEQLSIDVHIIENDKVLLTKEIDDLKHDLEEKTSMHQELEKVKASLHQQIQDFEHQLQEMKKGKTPDIDLTTELHKVTTEKTQIFEKFKQVNLEKSSLHEAVEKLEDEIVHLRQSETVLKSENEVLKNSTKTELENEKALQSTIENLKSQIIQQEILNTEIQALKQENHKIIERKVLVEAELAATDRKIAHLGEDFDKLIIELNEKDSIIETLNATIANNDVRLAELNQNITDLENSTEIKNKEIVRLTKLLEELNEKLNSTSVKSEKNVKELSKLHHDQEEVNKQIVSLNEEVNARNIEISSLTARLAEKEKNCTELKATIEVKDKEIKELNQSIVELRDKLKNTETTTQHNDEYAKVAQEKETIEREFIELKNNMSMKEVELSDMQKKSSQIEKTCIEYKSILETAAKEKTELINLINLKHNESIQYHTEIQRLNQVLLEQANELKRVVEDKNTVLTNQTEACGHCENLRITLKEKDEIIMTLNQNSTEYEHLKTELANARVKVEELTEKCDNLEKKLTQSLENVKRLTAENVQLTEQEQNSTRELERLRRHLVETEETYTQELMTSEQRLAESQTRLRQVEERAKQTGSVYTSNSIRANQEVETLRNQVKLLEKQREEVQVKLSEAEDSRSRGEAALTNLQVVLEQFQMDKERDINSATEKIRNRLESLRLSNSELHKEIARLNAKLEESAAGLKAASRLGDQVETKTAQINDLKEQVRTLQTSVSAAEERYYNSISNQQDKIDKNLVKNLVINYVTTAGQNSANKTQVLRILSTVLDFNQSECERLGLVKSANAPDSLAAEFVKFLQNESKPRAPMPPLSLTNTSRSNTPVSRKNSTMGPNPILPPESSHKRNPSTGSNNLLFQNIDNLETASTVSIESDRQERERQNIVQDMGVNQTRNNEGAILKYVLKDM